MDGNQRERSEPRGNDGGAVAYGTEFDWSDPDQPSAALVDVLARVEGVDPLDVDPIHDSLDPEALNALFARRNGNGATGSVTVTMGEYRVSIEEAGRIVAERDGA